MTEDQIRAMIEVLRGLSKLSNATAEAVYKEISCPIERARGRGEEYAYSEAAKLMERFV